ncbi:MAG: Fic family protein [Phycisphaerales bacterium]|jgi:Fic family protein|nr:Fic family protein [Phycisphaerales bacterium]
MDDGEASGLRIPGQWVPSHGYQEIVRDGKLERVRIDTKAFVPESLPPSIADAVFGRLLPEIVHAHTLLIRLEGVIAALPSPRAFIGPMGRREVVYSSQIEHTFASVEEVATFDHDARLQLPDDPVMRKRAIDRLEVWSNQQALEHGIAKDSLPLSLRLLRDMHNILMRFNPARSRAGEFRSGQVFIGRKELGITKARFVPPPPGEVLERCLGEFERFLHPTQYPRARFDTITELAMAHYQFECIHPFEDGNGRLGRLIIPLWPFKSDVVRFPLPYVSKALADNREEYYDLLLGVSVRGDWAGWISFFARMVAISCEADLLRAARLGALYTGYLEKLASSKRTSVKTVELLDLVFDRLSVTSADVQRHLGIAQPTADEYLQRFTQAGLLREVTGGSYRRRWFASPVNDAIHGND